jgi:hypothetical protein
MYGTFEHEQYLMECELDDERYADPLGELRREAAEEARMSGRDEPGSDELDYQRQLAAGLIEPPFPAITLIVEEYETREGAEHRVDWLQANGHPEAMLTRRSPYWAAAWDCTVDTAALSYDDIPF